MSSSEVYVNVPAAFAPPLAACPFPPARPVSLLAEDSWCLEPVEVHLIHDPDGLGTHSIGYCRRHGEAMRDALRPSSVGWWREWYPSPRRARR